MTRAIAPEADRSRATGLLVAALLLTIALPVPSRGQETEASAAEPRDTIEAYQRGMQANEAGDTQGYLDMMRQALRFQPGHPILMRHLAQGHAHLLHFDKALDWLDRVLAVGANFDFDSYDDLASLREHPSWSAFLERRAASVQPEGEAADSVLTGQRDLVPEGIAYDPRDDVFYLSSVAQRKIVRVTRDGTTTDFTQPGQDGYLCGLGLEVDPENRDLWGCSAAFAETGLFGEDERGMAAVHRYDLESGELLAKYVLTPEDGGEQDAEGAAADVGYNLNDLVIHGSGDVYVTDANHGAVYVVRHGGQGLELFLDEGSIPGANGITLTQNQSALYVAKYALGVVRVDLDTREVTEVRHPDSFTMCGVDGLYFVDGHLIAVQNMAGLDRVARFRLDPTGREAVACEVLIARQPLFVDPTTGVVAGKRFYFIANSQVTPYLQRDAETSMDAFDEVTILGLEL